MRRFESCPEHNMGNKIFNEKVLPTLQRDAYKTRGKRFLLWRKKDISGISGTGIVVEGWQDPFGECILVWIVGTHRSTEVHASIEDVIAIHGHEGATEVVWID